MKREGTFEEIDFITWGDKYDGGYSDEYEFPQGRRFCYWFFSYYIDDEEELAKAFEKCFRTYFADGDEFVYIVIKGLFGYTEKIQEYKKLWKGLSRFGENKFRNFDLGYEYDVGSGDERYYCGIAKTDIEHLKDAISMLLKNKSYFVYVTKNNIDVHSKAYENELKEIINTKYLYEYLYDFDFVKILEKIEADESVLSVVSDGECIALHICTKKTQLDIDSLIDKE